ncbi:unnamed protein product [Albugo candida]|uniref:EMC2 TPR-like domain-containing protein n=2 Tax=Albugo candida TaxID=65357 RepID=A0A024GSW8_9STRA|nr:unnamed protein product [Albugo candida]|eukprot:CCI49680.1 unnamed protein product [Albugo candida]
MCSVLLRCNFNFLSVLPKSFRSQSSYTKEKNAAFELISRLRATISPENAYLQQCATELKQVFHAFQPSENPKIGANEVFVNNHLRWREIDVVGFDYDYTLCHYTRKLQYLIYEMARDFMVNKLRYPEGIAKYTFDPSFAIRGLTIDKERGLLCKISSHQKLCYRSVFRGRQRLSREEIINLYGGSRHISVTYRAAKMEPLNDLFSVAHACLFADVVQYLRDHEIEYEPIAIVEDVGAAIQQVHLTGHMHKIVAQNIAAYVEPNAVLRPFLERLRSNGKKLFLCTNSSFPYIDAGLRHMVGDSWQQLFDVVLVSARKPNFYTRQRAFRVLDAKRKQVQWQAVRYLQQGQIYTQGSVRQLMNMTEWVGNRVLYIGDSLFSDLVEPSRINGWRTGAIIRELEDEINVQRTPSYQFLAFQISAIEEMLRKIHYERHADDNEESRRFVSTLVECHPEIQHQLEDLIHPTFGSVFRAESYPSQFAFFVQRYVDIYAARLENLAEYPEGHTFYPERLSLPHEQRIALETPSMEYLKKLQAAEKGGGYHQYVDLLTLIRKENKRVPHIVLKYGTTLIEKHAYRLGDTLWTIYELVFLAAIDTHQIETAELCLKKLIDRFPQSARVKRLIGMSAEVKGEFKNALDIYDKILQENPANALVIKRKIAVLKAQEKTQEVILALNAFLKTYQTDQTAWLELAETYLTRGSYAYAGFCYEELLLLNPADSAYHVRLADIYCTIGGMKNLRNARKHYSHALQINKQYNARALYGLLVCTASIAADKKGGQDPDDAALNARIREYAIKHLQQGYQQQAPADICGIATKVFEAIRS